MGEFSLETLFNLGEILHSVSQAIDLASREIARHQQRTAYIALAICRQSELPVEGRRELYIASLLHDIGAITISEKIALHRQEELYPERHCIKGELLLNRCPFFTMPAKIVRNHHRDNCDWREEGLLKNCAQILYLSDSVELSINRSVNNILQQKNRIIKEIKQKTGSIFDENIAAAFFKIAEKESFWLEMMSPQLENYLLKINPLKNEFINLEDLEIYSKFFRDLIDFKSPFTAAHSAGVSVSAELIGELINLDPVQIKKIKIAGNVHDLGKLIIDDNILMKNAPLSANEEFLMRAHPFHTYQILSLINGMDDISRIAGYHHERPSFSGYPFRLDMDSLELPVKIMIIADVLTAIIEERPYRKGMLKPEAFKIVNELVTDIDLSAVHNKTVIDNFEYLYDTVLATENAIKDFYENRLSVIN